jgi:hypothetical protein
MYWSIDYETNELKSKVVLTSVKPEDIPGFLITKEPPKKKAGYAIIYNHDKAVWEQVKDNRGITGYVDGTPYTHKDLSPLPKNFTEEKPPMSEEDVLAHVRMTRNSLLDKSDYFMLDDVFNNLTSKEADDLQSYRQALRDFPATLKNVTDIEKIKYPKKPEFV